VSDPFEQALSDSGVSIPSPANDPGEAPSLEDAVTVSAELGAPSQNAAPVERSQAQEAVDELADELTDDVILEAIATGFTVGLPMSGDQRDAFTEAYANSKIVKIGMKMTGLKDVAGGGLVRAIESNPIVRIGVGALLMLGSGALMRGQYVQQLQAAGALEAGSGDARRPNAGFVSDDLPASATPPTGEGNDFTA
jgi:hypothetical protein